MLPVAYAPNTFSFAFIYEKQYLDVIKECLLKLKQVTDSFLNSKVELYVLDPTENNPYVIFQCIIHLTSSKEGGSFCEESEYVESAKQIILAYISGYIDGCDKNLS